MTSALVPAEARETSPEAPDETPSTDPGGAERGPGRIRVLMIDDDAKLCRLVAGYLGPLGFDVDAAPDAPDGLARILDSGSELQAVILDLMLPGMDGFEALRRIRQKSRVPVLMLTARGDETDRIVGLELGADDYLPKTFSARELLARLRAVLRRANPAGPSGTPALPAEIVAGPIRINLEARSVHVDLRAVDLTPVEFDLLASLARARGRVKSREALLDEIRRREYDVFDRSIDVHVSSLRRKLGDDARNPRFIRTLRCAGYMMVERLPLPCAG